MEGARAVSAGVQTPHKSTLAAVKGHKQTIHCQVVRLQQQNGSMALLCLHHLLKKVRSHHLALKGLTVQLHRLLMLLLLLK